MAEYYPLLARAIAGLPQSTSQSRRTIYERARTALIGQLRAVQPPIAEADIERESRMLDEAIERLEKEIAAGTPPASTGAPPSPPPPARAPDTAAPEGRKLAEPMVRRAETPRAGALAPRPGLPPRPNLPPRPGAGAGDRPAGLGALEAARQRLASLSRPGAGARPLPVEKPVAGETPAPRPVERAPEKPAESPVEAPVVAAQPRDESMKVAAPAVEAPKPQPTDAEIAASRLSAEARPERRENGAAPLNVTLRKYGPRAEAAGVSADFPPAETNAFESVAGLGEEPQRAVRPAAPLPPEEKTRNLRPLLIGAPVALVVAAIAIFAYVRRDNPEEMARLRPAPGVEAPEQSTGKIVERIGGGQAARQQQTSPAQSQSPAQQQAAQQGQAPAPSGPAVPVSQRAALLVDAPDEPQRVKTYVGNVVWRLDNVSRGPGQPLAIGVRAEIELPDAKLRALVLIQKNTDETLPASHTVEVRFTPTEGGPIPAVAQISTPQMRKEDTPSGDALMGVPAPIMQNYFLVGLTRGDAAVSRNVDLLKNRGWVDIPILLSDQRIAKLTFEKGASGDRVINEALEAWK